MQEPAPDSPPPSPPGAGPVVLLGLAAARQRRQVELLGAALLSILLAVGITWPVALAPGERVVGHPGNDVWNHLWGHWWVGHELSQGYWPLRTALIQHPRGGTLYYIDTVQGLLFAPFTLLFGAEVGYNLTVLFGLSLAGFGAWLLARRVTGDPIAAGLALVVYEASPHLLGQSYNGISETVCAGWLPLSLWALVELLDRPTAARALRLGLLGGMTMLTSWYYGILAGLAGVLLLLWTALRRRAWVPWPRLLPLAALSGGVALAMVLPMLFVFRLSMAAEDAVVTRDPDFVLKSLLYHNVTDIAAFFLPSDRPSPDLKALYGEELVIIIYLGWLAIGLSLVALVAGRRLRTLSAWLVLALVFFLFSLGPYLNVGGDYLTLFGQRVPLPFLALFRAFPLFDRISHPFRFVTGVGLVLALGAALGARHLLRHQGPLRRAALTGLLGLLVLAETAWLSPARLPVDHSLARIPAPYAAMRQDPVPGAVLDLPMALPNLERAIYVWYQSSHQRPIPWGLNDPMPKPLLDNRFTATLIRFEASRAWSAPPLLPELDVVIGARTLVRQGYRYIVVHRRYYPAFKLERVERLLVALFGPPEVHEAEDMLVFRLTPLPAEDAEP